MSNLTQEQIDRLPDFALYDDGKVIVDPGVVYPQYLAELAECCEGVDKNQYWVEVARRCMARDLKMTIGPGFTLRLISPQLLDDEEKPTGEKANDAWALRNLPERAEDEKGTSGVKGSLEFLLHWEALQKFRQSKAQD